MQEGTIQTTYAALNKELDEIERRRNPNQPYSNTNIVDQTEDVLQRLFEQRAADIAPTALCLSGGGIRSAAFSLGVLQSLAASNLLNQFDYQSTVSGGGFIGGWLQILMQEPGGRMEAGPLGANSPPSIQNQLGNSTSVALAALRRYTNYLTPHTGPMSADTWGVIAIYMRNFIINWVVFLPAFLLTALVPVFYRTVLYAMSEQYWHNLVLLLFGGLALAVGASQAASCLPSHRSSPNPAPDNPQLKIKSDYSNTRYVFWWIVAPPFIWVFLTPFLVTDALIAQRADCSLTALLKDCHPDSYDNVQWIVPLVYVIAVLGGYLVAYLRRRNDRNPDCQKLYMSNFWRWVAATLIVAGLIWLGLYLVFSAARMGGLTCQIHRWLNLIFVVFSRLLGFETNCCCPWWINTPTAMAVFLPLALTLTHLLQTTLYVAFRREAFRADLDREWLARVSGLTLLVGVGTAVLAICCLVLPAIFILFSSATSLDSLSKIGASSGVAAAIGAPAAWLGKQLASQIQAVAARSSKTVIWLLNSVAVLFVILLLASSGALVQFVLGRIQEIVVIIFDIQEEQVSWISFIENPCWSILLRSTPIVYSLFLQMCFAVVLGFLVVWFGRINVNRYSLHDLYRNRLSRAFLGTARWDRDADPFTGFDPRDNLRFESFVTTPAGQRLFPVINMTLNVTAGTDTGWAERKAQSFTATPLACGSAALTQPNAAISTGAFAPTTSYAGKESINDVTGNNQGPGIGSLLTMSGAAVSPNWGYHSSPLVAFLMTLFNVRLGAWLPNPAIARGAELQLAKPAHSLTALLSELIGFSTNTSQAIYLSDGGHFENLGLYEMLRRRCRLIVVVDAGQDADCTFFDLGNAIRKASIDLHVTLKMPDMRIVSRKAMDKELSKPGYPLGFAVGEINYGENAAKGKLIYIKPSFLPDIPAQVRAYGEVDHAFPHQSTLDQWFTESEFESYRALGFWQMSQITNSRREMKLNSLFDMAEIQASRQ